MASDSPSPAPAAPRRRVAKGPRRPQYLKNAELDKFMMMFTAMLAEMSAMRDRIDTHEELQAQGLPASKANIEAFVASAETDASRAAARSALLKRVFRILLEESEEATLAISTRDLEQVLADDDLKSRPKG